MAKNYKLHESVNPEVIEKCLKTKFNKLGRFEKFIAKQLSKKFPVDSTKITQTLAQYGDELEESLPREVGEVSMEACIKYVLDSPSLTAYFKSPKAYIEAKEACKNVNLMMIDVYRKLADNMSKNIDKIKSDGWMNQLMLDTFVKATGYNNACSKLIASIIDANHSFIMIDKKVNNHYDALKLAVKDDPLDTAGNSFLEVAIRKNNLADKELLRYFDSSCTAMYKKLSPGYYSKALASMYYAMLDAYVTEVMPVLNKYLPAAM